MTMLKTNIPRLTRRLAAAAIGLGAFALSAGVAHATGLAYTLNNNGIASLTWNGANVLDDGSLRIINGPEFVSDPAGYDGDGWIPTTTTLTGSTIAQTYPWGSMTVTYTQSGNTLTMAGSITNSSSEVMDGGQITFMVSGFPSTPNGHMTDWDSTPMDNWVMLADPNFDPPMVGEDWGTGSVALCNDNIGDGMPVQVGGCWNSGTYTEYPFCTNVKNIAANTTQPFQVSLRFGNTGTSDANATDLFQKYTAYYPYQVQWTDRRLIAQDVLASSPPNDQPGSQHPASNPRGWGQWCTYNGSQIDFTQPTSTVYPEFRTALLAYASDTIAVLANMHAQGVIFWDLEGEQFSQPSHTYIGDPRLITTEAPEMGYTDGTGTTVNLFFQQFINAGYKVGVCIRPQQIESQTINGIVMPTQEEATAAGTTIYNVLQSKISYAMSNYGVSIFYTDTTVDPNGNTYDPTPFQQVTALYPSILMIPEEASTRYYSFGARFLDFGSQGHTGTDAELYNAYPGAFSNVMAGVGNLPPSASAFEASMAKGDLLMFHGWFDDEPNNGEILSYYNAALHPPAAAITSPALNATISGSTVTINATATPFTGKTISNVQFYETTKTSGRALLGTVTSSPYNYTWSSVSGGSYVLSIVANQSDGEAYNAAEVPITVNATLQPPVITSPTTATGTVGTAFSYQITATNSPTSYSETGTLPGGVTLNGSSGLISGTPTASGSFPVTIKATNSAGTGPQGLTITISLPAKPVITSATTATGNVGSAFSYQITATNNPTSYSESGTLPASLTFSSTTGKITGTPSATGTTTVTIGAINAGGTGTASLAITINSAVPVITSSGTATGTQGAAFSYQITATNSPTGYSETGTLPGGVTLNGTSGLISGTPTNSGSFPVTIKATNSGGTGSKGLTITINPPAPAITSPSTASGTTGTAFSYQITATNSPTSYSETGTLPGGVTLNGTSGLISGTPTAAGSFPITIKATNVTGTGSGPLTITITASSSHLTGSLGSDSGTINLTTEGTTDWGHWGSEGSGNWDHKSGGSAIGWNPGATVFTYGSDPVSFLWTDGGQNWNGQAQATGFYYNGNGTSGFSITAPADLTTRTLKFYVGSFGGTGTLTASLSDGSSPNYVNSSLAANGEGVYTLVYSAASAGQTLTVSWIDASGGRLTVQSASLH